MSFPLLLTFGCVGTLEDDPSVSSNQDKPTFEEFLANTYQEPWEGGMFIVNGDETVENVKKLKEFYDRVYGEGELIVHRSGGVDAKWNNTMKKQLTYCISDSFGSRKNTMIQAMAEATDNGWEQFADVDFIYVPSQDSNCTGSNNNVVFDVRPVSGQPYLARAFFPNQGRSSRNILVDTSSFNTSWPLVGILAHELGHALGFRHEHTRPEAGTCYEDSSWRPLTPYDSASIMHYPQCNGSSNTLAFSSYDAQGAAALYGEPSGGGEDPPPPPPDDPTDPPPSGGVTKTGSHSTSISRGQRVYYQPLTVVPGSRFLAQTTGSGDADLYVRFGAKPTLYSFHCRPYLNGSAETCDLDVPSGQTQAYIMVRGYRAASYTLTVTWVAPQ